MKSLEANMEAERATHLETKFNTEVLQVHARTHACRNAHPEGGGRGRWRNDI